MGLARNSVNPNPHQDWRQAHLGRLLGHAMRRFDERVLHLMANNVDVPLALSNLAARAQISLPSYRRVTDCSHDRCWQSG
jgi:transcriptional regulator GlxA family with amidase domain